MLSVRRLVLCLTMLLSGCWWEGRCLWSDGNYCISESELRDYDKILFYKHEGDGRIQLNKFDISSVRYGDKFIIIESNEKDGGDRYFLFQRYDDALSAERAGYEASFGDDELSRYLEDYEIRFYKGFRN